MSSSRWAPPREVCEAHQNIYTLLQLLLLFGELCLCCCCAKHSRTSMRFLGCHSGPPAMVPAMGCAALPLTDALRQRGGCSVCKLAEGCARSQPSRIRRTVLGPPSLGPGSSLAFPLRGARSAALTSHTGSSVAAPLVKRFLCFACRCVVTGQLPPRVI